MTAPNESGPPLWKGIVRCDKCGDVLNTAEHVPTEAKARVELSAPLMAVCPKRGHSTFSDCNFTARVEWELESAHV